MTNRLQFTYYYNVVELYNKIYNYIAIKLHSTISEQFDINNLCVEDIYQNISPPPHSSMGHFCFPTFFLAKKLKNSPSNISNKISEFIKNDKTISKINPEGPYINFFINSNSIGVMAIDDILNGSFFKKEFNLSKDLEMIEYSQPNTHKVLHVGHMRNLCMGNAIILISKYCGKNIMSATYPGDIGTHVAKCIWHIQNNNLKPSPKENPGEWLGNIYTKAEQKLNKQSKEQLEKSRTEISNVLKDITNKKGNSYKLWKETRNWSIEFMKDIYKWAKVEFDNWFWESELDIPSINFAKELLNNKILIKDNNAIGMDLSDEGLGFCMIIKSDGIGLYLTKDIELARIKFEKYNVKKNIYIVDNRQSYHFKQLFTVLKRIGFKQAKNCVHLPYAMVELPNGAMSSRKGNIVTITEAIKKMESTVKKNYLDKYLENNKWPKEEIDEKAYIIASGALKYGFLRIDNNKKIIFNMNQWLKLDGETGPYLQYTYARIISMLNKNSYNKPSKSYWDLLKSEYEINLMVKLSLFNNIVFISAKQLKTIHLCSYLYELGKLFNNFYSNCPIAKEQEPKIRITRMNLSYATSKIIKKGLELLGIDVPNRM